MYFKILWYQLVKMSNGLYCLFPNPSLKIIPLGCALQYLVKTII